MVKPADELAPGPAGPGGLRASHADREWVIDVLKAAFVQGRLTKDEFDLRVSEAFAARTCAGLRVLMADMPAGLARRQPPGPIPELGRQPAWRVTEQAAVRMIAAVLVAVPSTAFGVGLLESGTRPELSIATRLLYIILFACIVAVPATGLVIFHSWLARHSATHSSPRPPGAGSPTASPAGRLAPADPAQPFPQIRRSGRHGTAWAVLRILAGPPFPPAGQL
jgi:DUF1707 SHOCT-like domain